MKNKTFLSPFVIVVLAIFTMTLLAACSPTAAPATEPITSATDPAVVQATEPVASTLDGATLMDERCSVCHSTKRITSAAMTLDEWTTVVDRMINKGADLSADERQVLIDYLAATYK